MAGPEKRGNSGLRKRLTGCNLLRLPEASSKLITAEPETGGVRVVD